MASLSIQSGRTKAQYKAFLNNVDLYAIGLDSISAELRRQQYSEVISNADAEVSYKVATKFSVSDFDDDHFDILARFELSMVAEGVKESLLEVRTTFSAHFHPKDGQFLREHTEKFAKAEGRLLFWPYFRQILSDTTARMHIRPITIPWALNP